MDACISFVHHAHSSINLHFSSTEPTTTTTYKKIMHISTTRGAATDIQLSPEKGIADGSLIGVYVGSQYSECRCVDLILLVTALVKLLLRTGIWFAV